MVDANGEVLKAGNDKDNDAFKMGSKDISENCLPLYVCSINDEKKFVVPVYGMGLWGGLWGYVSINSDGNTVYGAYFSHESETAGLGALITEEKFQNQFHGKTVFDMENNVALSVLKVGKTSNTPEQSRCDAITGATLTSDGVDNMLKVCLKNYANVFKRIVK